MRLNRCNIIPVDIYVGERLLKGYSSFVAIRERREINCHVLIGWPTHSLLFPSFPPNYPIPSTFIVFNGNKSFQYTCVLFIVNDFSFFFLFFFFTFQPDEEHLFNSTIFFFPFTSTCVSLLRETRSVRWKKKCVQF